MVRDPDPSDKKKPKQFNTYIKYSGLAMQLVITIGVAGWLGHKLDNYLDLNFPLFILIFTISSFTGVLFLLYQSINKY